MNKTELNQIREDIVKIIADSYATFFVKEDVSLTFDDEALYELKAEICTNVERYFYDKLNQDATSEK